jgi:hypothetical protein
MATYFTVTRVSVGDERIHGEEELGFQDLIHSRGSDFIDVQGRRLSSGASEWRRWIERLQELHRAASQLEEEEGRIGKLRGLDWLPKWAGLVGYDGWPAVRLVLFFSTLFLLFISCFLFCYF